MDDKRTRYVSVYELWVHPKRARSKADSDWKVSLSIDPFVQLTEIAKAATARQEPLTNEIEDDRGRYLYLQDMEIRDRRYVCFLWRLRDPSRPIQYLHQQQGNTTRKPELQPGEAPMVAAHMVLDLNDPKKQLRYRFGLEEITNISRSRIVPYWQELMRTRLPRVAVTDGEGRLREGEPMLVVDATMGPMIAPGSKRPISFELVRKKPRKNVVIAGADRWHETRKRITFNPLKGTPISRVLEQARALSSHFSDQMPDHEQVIHWEDSDTGKQDTTKLLAGDRRTEMLFEKLMTRSEQLDFDFDVESSYDSLEPRIVEAIINRLNNPTR